MNCGNFQFWRNSDNCPAPHVQDSLISRICDQEKNVLIGYPYFFTICKGSLKCIYYVGRSVSRVLGKDVGEFREGNEQLIFDRVIEDEKEQVAEMLQFRDVWLKTRAELNSGRSFEMYFRLWNYDGGISHVLQQVEVLTYTPDRKPEFILSRYLDISSLAAGHLGICIVENQSNQLLLSICAEFDRTHMELTKRESQVEELVNHGFSSGEIAERLEISIKTVSTHRKNIIRKKKENGTSASSGHRPLF